MSKGRCRRARYSWEVIFTHERIAEIASEPETILLPMLAEAGFIDWDRESGEIRRGPNFEGLRPLLELIVVHQDELPDGRLLRTNWVD